MEKEWIRSSLAGDPTAFNRLVLKWEKTVFNLNLRMLRDPDEAAEVTQEVFMAAFKNLKRFRLEAKFSTWLYRIASNQCLTRLRRRPRMASFSLDQETKSPFLERQLSQKQLQEREVLRREHREGVHTALQQLSPEQRIVVELKIYQERKFDEIADIVQAPSSTVKSRFYASLEVLKGSLAHLAYEI
jgi:RNA polymerase sigma-70 factor (ECF subfamily)